MICQKKRKNIMDVNFEYYKIFYYVAKYHNFTKAAQALNNSQPNITRAMNCLEQQLNTTLFIRTNRGVQLTPEGEQFEYMYRLFFFCYCSLVTFREVFFVNKVHRKPEKCGAKSCECMISVHREAHYCERSEQ